MKRKKFEERLDIFIFIMVGMLIGFFLTTIIIVFNIGGILENNGLMYQKDCLLLNSSINDTFHSLDINYSNEFYFSDYGFNVYANTPYIQATPYENKSKIIVFQCQNSTLVITNNSIECVKDYKRR